MPCNDDDNNQLIPPPDLPIYPPSNEPGSFLPPKPTTEPLPVHYGWSTSSSSSSSSSNASSSSSLPSSSSSSSASVKRLPGVIPSVEWLRRVLIRVWYELGIPLGGCSSHRLQLYVPSYQPLALLTSITEMCFEEFAIASLMIRSIGHIIGIQTIVELHDNYATVTEYRGHKPVTDCYAIIPLRPGIDTYLQTFTLAWPLPSHITTAPTQWTLTDDAITRIWDVISNVRRNARMTGRVACIRSSWSCSGVSWIHMIPTRYHHQYTSAMQGDQMIAPVTRARLGIQPRHSGKQRRWAALASHVHAADHGLRARGTPTSTQYDYGGPLVVHAPIAASVAGYSTTRGVTTHAAASDGTKSVMMIGITNRDGDTKVVHKPVPSTIIPDRDHKQLLPIIAPSHLYSRLFNGWQLMERLPGGSRYGRHRRHNYRWRAIESDASHMQRPLMVDERRATVTRAMYEWRGARSVTMTVIMPHMAHTSEDARVAGMPVRKLDGRGAEHRVTTKPRDNHRHRAWFMPDM